MSAREVARRALRRIEGEQMFAASALDAEMGAGLDERDRGLATEIVYGVLRHRTRLDRALEAMAHRGLEVSAALRTVLRVAAYQILFLDRVPAHAAVDDAVDAARAIGGARMAGFANGLLRRLAADGEPRLPAGDLSVRYSLPGWILDHLKARVGAAELEAAAAALAEPAPLYLRTNRLSTDRDTVLARLAADHPQARFTACMNDPDAIAAEGLGDPERSPSFRDGWWTVQDLGAQRVGRLLGPRPGEMLLDACAGVGGKSTHLAQLTGDRAAIDAADLSEHRLRLGEAAARRLGLTHIRFHVMDLTRELPGGPWDGVLLDAPCTGLGVLRRHPEAKWRLRAEAVAEMAELQARLLDRVATGVGLGGALVYSVCTFTEAEGPDQVAAFRARHPDFSVEEVLETWPHRGGADAFYAVRMRRAAGA